MEVRSRRYRLSASTGKRGISVEGAATLWFIHFMGEGSHFVPGPGRSSNQFRQTVAGERTAEGPLTDCEVARCQSLRKSHAPRGGDRAGFVAGEARAGRQRSLPVPLGRMKQRFANLPLGPGP